MDSPAGEERRAKRGYMNCNTQDLARHKQGLILDRLADYSSRWEQIIDGAENVKSSGDADGFEFFRI